MEVAFPKIVEKGKSGHSNTWEIIVDDGPFIARLHVDGDITEYWYEFVPPNATGRSEQASVFHGETPIFGGTLEKVSDFLRTLPLVSEEGRDSNG